METSEQQEDLYFSDLLKKFRRHKKLTQQQLAERIEVSRDSVSLWERGQYKPEADRILYKIVDVLGLTTQEQRQLFEAYTVTALATSFHNPPLKRNPYFTGRSSQLHQLHILLMAGRQVALTQAISGLGGIGKTQLAVEYAYRYQKSYHDIFWAIADTNESLMVSYVRLAGLLHLSEYGESDQSKAKAAIQHWLSKHTGWLLILDNIEDLNLVNQFVPVDRQGAVLLTTRRHVTEPVAQVLELGLLPEHDGILFLLKRTKILTFDMSLDDASAHDIAAARTIAQALGNLPLALDQAGAYILETRCGLSNYLDLLKKHQPELLRRRTGKEIPTDHPDSVATTFILNFQQIRQRCEVAVEMLRVCAFLAPDDIGEEILVQGASELGLILQPLGSDSLLLNQAIEALRTFSLIQRDPEKKTLAIHRLVQAVLHDAMEEQESEQWAMRVVSALDTVFPEVTDKVWSQCERLVRHSLTCTAFIAYEKPHLKLASLLHKTADYLRERGQDREAEPLYQRVLYIRERVLGPGHPDVALSLNNLAVVYGHLGKYEQEEQNLQQALYIWEHTLGLDHPDYATALSNLATLYQNQGKYEQAEPLLQRALHLREQALGPDLPQVAVSLDALAIFHYYQGKYEQAELLFQRALHLREQTLGPDHFDVADSLNGLANVYQIQGKYEQAEPLFQRALHLREQALGPDHPNVAVSRNDLALLYYRWGKYEQAELLFQQALRVMKLAGESDRVATALNNLALLYRAQGKYEQAEPLYQQAFRIWEHVLGSEHPNVAYALNGLAVIYRAQGKYEQADSLFQRALSLRQHRRGSQHLETAESLYEIALLYELREQSDRALAFYEQALVIREQALGLHHLDTVKTRQHYTTLLRRMGQQDEAALPGATQFEQVKTEEEQEKYREE